VLSLLLFIFSCIPLLVTKCSLCRNTGGEERGGSGGGGWGQGGGGGGAASEEEFVSMEDPEKVDGGDFELPGFEEEEEKKAEGVFGIAGGRRKGT